MKQYVKQPNEVDIDGLPLETFIDDNQNDDDYECSDTSNSKTKKRSKARIIRSVWFNVQTEPEKHRELLMLFTPWRREETDLIANFSSSRSMYVTLPYDQRPNEAICYL